MNRIVQSLNAKDSSFQRLYNKEIEDFYVSQNNAHSKYISFLNSLRFISSRIPAQSLQSFMPMKCVGWTKNNSNTAYVSYIQTFLQGSDYKDYFRISLS